MNFKTLKVIYTETFYCSYRETDIKWYSVEIDSIYHTIQIIQSGVPYVIVSKYNSYDVHVLVTNKREISSIIEDVNFKLTNDNQTVYMEDTFNLVNSKEKEILRNYKINEFLE